MKSVGQILRQKRLEKDLSVSHISKLTKIHPKFIEAIEQDDYRKLPNSTVAKGFVRNYAECVGINPDNTLAVLRRDFIENQSGQIVPRGIVNPPQKQIWSPKYTIIAVVAIFIMAISSYLVWQYTILTGPPPLKVMSPVDNLTTEEDTVLIEGVTSPESVVSVNGQRIILEKAGRIFMRHPLNPGPNEVVIEAESKSGKKTKVIRKVNLTSQR